MKQCAMVAGLGASVVAGMAAGGPPLDKPEGLHGTGPLGLMRAADVDGDGRAELLVEDSRGRLAVLEARRRDQPPVAARVVWASVSGVRDVAWGDIDRDGDIDLASVGDDGVRWHERLAPGDLGGGGHIADGWATHEIAPSPGASAIALGDYDRDGDLDCLAPGASGSELVWYRRDSVDGGVAFTADLTIALGAAPAGAIVGDFNRDGWADVVSFGGAWVAVHLRDPGQASFSTVAIDLGLGEMRHVAAVDADGDGDPDLAIVGDDALVLAVNEGGAWAASVLAGGLDVPRRVHVADLDRDGTADFVVEVGGQSAKWVSPGSEPEGYAVAVRSYGPIAVFDMDGDGDEDLIASLSIGPLLWRENLLIHRSDALPRREDVAVEIDGAFAVASGDLDGDGDLDLVSAAFNGDAVAWHENIGGVFLSHDVLSGVNGPVSVVCADLDLDGRLDIASAWTNDDAIYWHRNLGGSPPVFETFQVAGDADGVFSIAAGDLDRDGRVDLISAEKNVDRVRWFRNVEVGGAVEFSAGLVKGGVAGAFGVSVADVDADGWPDVLSASRDDDSVRVLRNLGGDLSSFQTILLSNRADGAAHVCAADLDGDGDLDVASASRGDSRVRWFENDGGSPPSFFERTIDTGASGATWVSAADLEGDGDTDLVVAARESGQVLVYRSNGASPPSFTRRALAETSAFVSCVEPGDIDGDGRVDVALAAVSDDLVAWYRNEGGALAAMASDIAPETIPAWGVAGLFRVDCASRARSGEGDIRLESLTLRFEDEAGAPLSSEQVSLLVQRLALHVDDGDGAFGPLVDEEVAAIEQIVLEDGEMVLELPGSAGVFSPGQSRTLFLAVRMAERAGVQDVTSFRVVVVRGRAVDVRNGSVVPIEDDRARGTGLISAGCPADMTGSDDADDPGFGVPDGVVDQIDFSYYSLLYDTLDPEADLTSTDDGSDPSYAIPDGVVDTLDLFFFLDRFSEGC